MNNSGKTFYEKLQFQGNSILFSLLSIVFFAIYILYFGSGYQFQELGNECPNWLCWYIFAIAGGVFIGFAAVTKNKCPLDFVWINSIIVFLAFYNLQVYLYKLSQDEINLFLFDVSFGVISLALILKRIKKFKRNWPWVTPIIFIILTLFYSNPLYITILSCGLLIVNSVCSIETSKPHTRVIVILSLTAIYWGCVFIYCPYNPLLAAKNIKLASITYNPRRCSVVVEEDNMFMVVNGITMEKVTDVHFTEFNHIEPFPTAFVGFRKFNLSDSVISTNTYPKSTLYPLLTTDSCVYFSSDIPVFKSIEKYKLSSNSIYSRTSLAFYDYAHLYEQRDSVAKQRLIKTLSSLQSIIDKECTDTTVFINREEKTEVSLRKLSRNMSIGMLNALSLDLIQNGYIDEAFNIFSYQFFFTFFDDADFYKNITVTFTITNKQYGRSSHEAYYTLTNKDLEQPDRFEHWVHISSMCNAFAESYNTDAKTKSLSYIWKILTGISEMSTLSSASVFDQNLTIEKRKLRDEFYEILSGYKYSQHIKEYSTKLQSFLYECIIKDYLNDYNSYFLNRFNEITLLVPLNPESLEYYRKLKSIYVDKFDMDIKDILEIQNAYNELTSQLYQIQDKQSKANAALDKLGFKDNSLLKELLFNLAKEQTKK